MDLQTAFSTPRLSKYQTWAAGDSSVAWNLYALNSEVSEAFYTSLHVLEIVLRNAIDRKLTAAHGVNWMSDPNVVTDAYQQQKVSEAQRQFQGRYQPGDLLAEMTFGFWCGFFGRHYASAWGPEYRQLFSRNVKLQRKDIARRLTVARRLRNRIAHHEPIVQLDLTGRHREICELIGWMSQDALIWCNARCRFNAVHPGRPIIVGNLIEPSLLRDLS